MTLFSNPRALGYHHHAETLDSVAARSYMHGYNWHYFEETVSDLWIRRRSEHVMVRDGKGLLVKSYFKRTLRRLLVNRLTISWIADPLIRKAERKPGLTFMVPFLTGKVASYHFHKGIRDSLKKNRVSERRKSQI